MRDFERRRAEFERDFRRTERRGRLLALIVFPFYLIGALLVLGILAVVLYGLARYVGLI